MEIKPLTILLMTQLGFACSPGIDDTTYGSATLGERCAGDVDCAEGLVCEKRRCTEAGQFPRQWGTPEDDLAYALAVDAEGNLYVGGQTNGALGEHENLGKSDAFITKLSTAGEILWHAQFGSEGEDQVQHIAVGKSGNLFAAGNLRGDPGDAFVAGYTPEGEQLWLTSWGTDENDFAYALALDEDENAYLTGCIGCPWFLQEVLLPETYGNSDGFLIKVSPDGDIVWTTTWDDHEKESSCGIALTGEAVYVAGHYGSPASEEEETGLLWNSELSAFSREGELIFNHAFGGDLAKHNNEIARMAADSLGNIYGTGPMDFRMDENMKVSSGAMLVKWSLEGEVLWSAGFGDNFFDVAGDIAIKGDDRILIAGYTGNGTADLFTGSGFDVFVGEYGPDGDEIETHVFENEANEIGARVAVGPKGEIYLSGYTNGAMGEKPNQGKSDVFVLRVE